MIFLGGVGTYLGHHEKNKRMRKIPIGKRKTTKKGDMSRKVARTATLTKDISQIRLSDELDILLATFGPSEITQDETKEVLDQDEFTIFQGLFQNKYHASNNTHFLSYLLCL